MTNDEFFDKYKEFKTDEFKVAKIEGHLICTHLEGVINEDILYPFLSHIEEINGGYYLNGKSVNALNADRNTIFIYRKLIKENNW